MTVTMERNTDTQLTGIGTRLKTAREALRLSEKDAAARLHLNPNIISIIETEHFENGPPLIFMRGYLRSYARLLSVSDEEINAALSKLDMIKPTATVTTTSRSIQPQPISNKLTRWMTYLIVLLLITLVAMWWRSTHTNNNTLAKVNETPAETIAPSTTVAVALNNTVQAVSSPNIAPNLSTTNTASAQQPATPTTAQPTVKTPPAIQTAPEKAQPITPPIATTNTSQTTPLPEIAPTTETQPETTTTPPAIPAETAANKAQPEPETTGPDLVEAKMEVPEQGLESDAEEAPNTQITEDNN